MTIMVRQGQTIETTDDYLTLEGVALEDWDPETEKPLVIVEAQEALVMTIRTDLATSLLVDGVEIIDQL